MYRPIQRFVESLINYIYLTKSCNCTSICIYCAVTAFCRIFKKLTPHNYGKSCISAMQWYQFTILVTSCRCSVVYVVKLRYLFKMAYYSRSHRMVQLALEKKATKSWGKFRSGNPPGVVECPSQPVHEGKDKTSDIHDLLDVSNILNEYTTVDIESIDFQNYADDVVNNATGGCYYKK